MPNASAGVRQICGITVHSSPLGPQQTLPHMRRWWRASLRADHRSICESALRAEAWRAVPQ